MKDKEFKKIMDEMKKAMDEQYKDLFMKGTFSTAVDPASYTNSQKAYVSIPYPSVSFSGPYYPNISPTDKDAKGKYPYQEPEVDEQGTYYGYKVLNVCRDGSMASPRYPAVWDANGELQADHEPSENTMHGIHFTKRPDHRELENYMRGYYATHNPVLVKCALSGTIIETEQGFRAEHAQIIGVLENGYWKSYQDYQERSRPYSGFNPEEKITYNPRQGGKNWFTFDDPIDPKA